MQVSVNNKAHPLSEGANRKTSHQSRRFYFLLLQKIWAGMQTHNSIDLAAQMSFYFVLSLFPFLLVIAAIIGWLPSTSMWQNFAQWIVTYLPHDSRKLLFAEILDLTRGYSTALSFGLLGTLWAASSGFTTLIESLNIAYGVKETRGFWHRRAIAIVATSLAAIFFIASFGVLALGHSIAAKLSLDIGQASLSVKIPFEFARWLANLLLMCLALDLMNCFLPDFLRPRWRWITPGRLFVALTFVVASVRFNLYVRYFADYPRAYGALAGFMILMLWVYVGSLILLIGAEIDDSLGHLHEHPKSYEPDS